MIKHILIDAHHVLAESLVSVVLALRNLHNHFLSLLIHMAIGSDLLIKHQLRETHYVPVI